MTARDEAIEAVYRKLITIYRADIARVLDAAVPVLLNDLADRIQERANEADRMSMQPEQLALRSAAALVRAAAEGWGA